MHRIALDRWTLPTLRIAVLADLHACWPWVTLNRTREIVEQVNALGADIILLSGDYLPDSNMVARHYTASQIVPELSKLSAPRGVYSVLGNHDWGEDPAAQGNGYAHSAMAEALEKTGITCLQNANRAVAFGARKFWLVGLDSQRGRGKRRPGLEDPFAAYHGVTDGDPVILLAHEPDYFVRADSRPVVQISGHTHGGQFRWRGRRPMTPSSFKDRYADGHIVEQGRHLVVSAGIGYSGLPFRFGVSPEITLVELSQNPD